MGYFLYDGYTRPIAFDDRTLAHLRIAIVTKLRNKEGFAFSWVDSIAIGGGRSTVWIHAGVGLRFLFDSSAQEPINRRWIHDLLATGYTARGLHVVAEPAPEAEPDPAVPEVGPALA